MSIFGAIVRTAINVVTLPITLPVAVLKEVTDPYPTGQGAVSELIDKIKEEAESDE